MKKQCIRNKLKLNMPFSKKAISLVLMLSLCLASVIQPLSTSAGNLGTSSAQMETEAGAFTPVQDEAISAEKVVLKSADLKKTKDAVVLQYIGEEQFDRANHTMRLKQHEDLHTFVFQNLDGTRTLYVMDEDVKYIDANGETIDKDISLVSKTKGFGIVQNEVDLLIPNSVQNGIDVAYNGYAIKLTPQGLVTRASAKKEDNSIVYEGAFGTNTSLKYTPLLSGIKEDIILSSYMPNVNYTFVLETDGLRVRQNEGRYYLADPAKKDPVFYLGEILVYDAIGKPDMGTMTVTTVEEGQKYLLTITVDDEFLSDLTTEYPVTIDPSITISDSTTTGSIEDAPIFQNYPNTNFGTYAYNRVGTPSAAYGVGRTVVRLRGLIDSEEYQNITENQIVAAYFYVTEASGGAPQTVELYPLINANWTESTATWTKLPDYSADIDCSAVLSYNREAEFDITALVIAWKNGTHDEETGFILKHTNESLNKAICSSEFSTASKRPRVVVTYESNIYFQWPQAEIQVGQTKQLVVYTNPVGQTVSWESSDESIVTVSATGELMAKKMGIATIKATMWDFNGVPYEAYCTIFVRFSDGEYYLENQQTGCYAGVLESEIGGNAHVKQWNWGEDYLLKWTFTNLEGGYYSIKLTIPDPNTSYYLGVSNDSTGLNANVVLRTGTLTDGMKWKIEETDVGAYILIPKTGEANDYILATSTTSSTGGAILQQGAYMGNNNSYCDEWMICNFDYRCNVNHYYDEGFELRYQNAELPPDKRIRQYHNEVDKRLMRMFGIHLAGRYEAITSEADKFKGTVTADNINQTYQNYPDQLTTDGLRSSVNYEGTKWEKLVIWTGHILNYNMTSDSNLLRHSVVMTPHHTTTGSPNYILIPEEKVKMHNIYSFMHEMSHQFDAKDHYCLDLESEEVCGNTLCDRCYIVDYQSPCIMSNRTYDLYSFIYEDMYCNKCIDDINTYLNPRN